MLPWREKDNPEKEQMTVWTGGALKPDFGMSGQFHSRAEPSRRPARVFAQSTSTRSPLLPRDQLFLLPRRQWALVENHPIQTEPILHLSKAEGKERLFQRHQDTAALGQRRENALRLDVAIRSQRQVSTAHRLSVWDVRRH